MPTYDYKCTVCSHTFELFQPMSAEPIKVCPVCNGEVKRIIGPGLGPIFKGTGFYQTDYKSTNSQAGKKDAQTGESKNIQPPKITTTKSNSDEK